MDGKEIFRVEVDEKAFYRLNIFPTGVLNFFGFIDQGIAKQGKEWHVMYEVKDEVLRLWPEVSFSQILQKHRTFLRLTKPKLKGVIALLEEFEKGKFGAV
jgi:hypothetical protein